MKCRNCDKQLKVGEFVSQSVLFPGEVLTTVEHEDGTLFCGGPFNHEDKRTTQLPGTALAERGEG